MVEGMRRLATEVAIVALLVVRITIVKEVTGL